MMTPQELQLITQLSNALEEQVVLNAKQGKLNAIVATHVKDAKKACWASVIWLIVLTAGLGYLLY